MANVKFEGGKELEKLLAKAGKGSVQGVDVGVFASSAYQDGTPVAAVLATHEFGDPDRNIPERPTFRPAIQSIQDKLVDILKKSVDPKKMIVDAATAGRMGLALQQRVQLNITQLTSPPNSPSTIAAKGSSSPLIDTGQMRESITYKVDK